MLQDQSTIIIVILFVIGFMVYFLPTIVAWSRKHHQETAIFFANLLVGWTVIGWVAVLIWSLLAVQKGVGDNHDGEDVKTCPYCAESIKPAAVVCRYCGKDLSPKGNT